MIEGIRVSENRQPKLAEEGFVDRPPAEDRAETGRVPPSAPANIEY